MNEPGGNDVQPDILESIDALLRENAYVSCVNFERVFKEDTEENIPLKQMDEILKFISDQNGLWQAEWFFSPEQSPDVNAKQEMDDWDIMWQGCSNAFAEFLPDGIEIITRRHNLIVALHSSERRVKFNENRPFERFTTVVFSTVAHWINKLGLNSLAGTLMTISMFHKGTVGRSS